MKRKFFDVRRASRKVGFLVSSTGGRRTADAAAVSQKVRKLSERRHGGGRLKNNCSKRDFVRCPEKQVVYREVELRNVNVR